MLYVADSRKFKSSDANQLLDKCMITGSRSLTKLTLVTSSKKHNDSKYPISCIQITVQKYYIEIIIGFSVFAFGENLCAQAVLLAFLVKKHSTNLSRHNVFQKSVRQHMQFDFLQQFWKYVASLLQIMIDPSDNASIGQLFSFRLMWKNVSNIAVHGCSMLDNHINLKALVFLYAFEESVECHLLSSFCDDSNSHISLFKYVLCTMGVSKDSISKFSIGNRFHVKLRILSPEHCKQSLRVKS